MKYSPLFMGVGIGIWGWFNQAWLAAGILIALILLNPLVGWRWEVNRKQFYRVVDFSFVLVILMLAYGYLGNSDTNPIYHILQWSPVLIAPIVLAQIYSSGNRLPMSALFYGMRGDDGREQPEIDFTLPFVMVAVMAAGAANIQSSEYFVLAVIFIGVILWVHHPRHFSKISAVLIFTIAIAISHFGNQSDNAWKLLAFSVSNSSHCGGVESTTFQLPSIFAIAQACECRRRTIYIPNSGSYSCTE